MGHGVERSPRHVSPDVSTLLEILAVRRRLSYWPRLKRDVSTLLEILGQRPTTRRLWRRLVSTLLEILG